MEVTNRFSGIDLIDRVPEELWMEVHDIVQETGIKTITWKGNAKKQNGCREALQMAEKKKKQKAMGERS